MGQFKQLLAYNVVSEDLGRLHRLINNRGINLEIESNFKLLLKRVIQDQPEFIFVGVEFEKLEQMTKKLKLLDQMVSQLGSSLFIVFPKKNMQVLDCLISSNLNTRNILFSSKNEIEWATELEENLFNPLQSNQCLRFNDEEINVKVNVQGSVRRLGELNCVLSSPLFLQGNTPINISSALFDGLEISYFDLKKIGHSYATHENEFITEYAFRGLPESSAKLIRAQKNKWR